MSDRDAPDQLALTPLGAPTWRLPFPSDRWQEGVTDRLVRCFIEGCDYTDIDPRGPVFIRGMATRGWYACTEHWEAIMGVLGRQAALQEDGMTVRYLREPIDLQEDPMR